MSGAERCGAPTSSGRPCRRYVGPDGCPSHPAAPATLEAWVDRALTGLAEDWRTALARRLAQALDVEPTASVARELRATMAAIAAEAPAPADVADQLRERRAARRAAAASQ